MSDVPVQVIVAAFQDEKSANLAHKELKRARREKLIGIQNAAVIRKDLKGNLHIKETADMGGGKGAALGGVAGAAIGILAGPALFVPAAVGALVGGLAARLRDSGFSDQRLETIGESLEPGTSAIIAIVEHKWVAQVEQALAESGADMFIQALNADIANQLEAGHEVAFTALATQEGFAVSRVAGGEDMVKGGSLVIDESGMYGSRFLATKDGFAVEQIAAADDAVVDEVMATNSENVVMGSSVVTDEGVVAASAYGKLETADEESEGDQ